MPVTQRSHTPSDLKPRRSPERLSIAGALHPTVKKPFRKTPAGVPSSALQNGKHVLRSIPPGKVTLSCGLAGRLPLQVRPTHFQLSLKVPSNLSSPELPYSSQQHLAFVLPRCCRSSIGTYDTRHSPTVPFRTPRFSREFPRTLFDSARQQLPSAKRFEFVRHE